MEIRVRQTRTVYVREGDAGTEPTRGVDVGSRPTPIGVGTQEVRFATAMTGGVSLAVWMGGVAREMNLLEQAARRRDPLVDASAAPVAVPGDAPVDDAETCRDLYLRLLEMLDLTVQFDVLSGTSAGGINAALVGFARVNRLDLAPLRDVWLEVGSFERLLREPSEKSPPSLLQGDGVLLAELGRGIEKLSNTPAPGRREPTPANPAPPTQVFVTTTLMAGEVGRFRDAFGTQVQDVDHRGLFVFDEQHLAADEGKAALGLAARCSASYPGAFEPAFVPCGESGPDDSHPDMRAYSNTTRSAFVVDGSLLANRPLAPILRAIFDRPAERQVRRVLLYVVPSSGDAPDPTVAPASDKFGELPSFAGALVKDLGAVLKQSIGAELRAIQEHTDRVGAIGDTRLRLAELGTRLEGGLLTATAFADFRARQTHALTRSTVDALTRAFLTMSDANVPPAWTEWLGRRDADLQLQTVVEQQVTHGWPSSEDDCNAVPGIAGFGRPPLEGAKATVLAMLRAGWALASTPAHRDALADANKKVHQAVPAAATTYVATRIGKLLDQVHHDSTESVEAFVKSVTDALAVDADERVRIALSWDALADVLTTIAPVLAGLATEAGEVADESASRTAAVEDLTTYLRYLYRAHGAPEPGDEPVPVTPGLVVLRLFQLFAVERSILPDRAEVEQFVELVQISADTRTKLSKRSTAMTKLTGMQLFHFGAFYKPSWRANDWMWGRLDGAGWLVHVLLDPRRVVAVAEREGVAIGDRADWFVATLRTTFPELDPPDHKVTEELASLDGVPTNLVTSFPETALWVATAWQRDITIVELPVVAREMVVNPSPRTSKWALDVLKTAKTPESIVAAADAATQGLADGDWKRQQKKFRDWVHEQARQELSDQDRQAMVAKLESCPVPDEKITNELGQPLFTRTVTKATAVGAAATAEAKELPTVVRPALASLRSGTLLAYRLAAVTRGRRRNVFAVGVAAIILGILVQWLVGSVFGIAGISLAIVGVALIVLVMFRSLEGLGNWLKIGALAVATVVAIVAVSLRGQLFGDDAESDGGVVGRNVIPWLQHDVPDWAADTALPWLRDPWWHVLVALGVFAVLVGLLGYGITRLLRFRTKPG